MVTTRIDEARGDGHSDVERSVTRELAAMGQAYTPEREGKRIMMAPFFAKKSRAYLDAVHKGNADGVAFRGGEVCGRTQLMPLFN